MSFACCIPVKGHLFQVSTKQQADLHDKAWNPRDGGHEHPRRPHSKLCIDDSRADSGSGSGIDGLWNNDTFDTTHIDGQTSFERSFWSSFWHLNANTLDFHIQS